jgi:hypothetical protein
MDRALPFRFEQFPARWFTARRRRASAATGSGFLKTLFCCAHTSVHRLRVKVPGNPHPWYQLRGHVYLASAYALKGDRERAAAELGEARKLEGEGSWQSVARLRAGTRYETPDIRALAEATYWAGLRKAGMPEE